MCINKMQDAIVGQAIEIIWRNNFTCPSEADYKRLTTKSKNINTRINFFMYINILYINKNIHA